MHVDPDGAIVDRLGEGIDRMDIVEIGMGIWARSRRKGLSNSRRVSFDDSAASLDEWPMYIRLQLYQGWSYVVMSGDVS
jgi:hypothetical protein